jgi:hypothetical protein
LGLRVNGFWIFRNSDGNIPTFLQRIGLTTASGFAGTSTLCLNQESSTEIAVDNGTSGQYRDFKARDLRLNPSSSLTPAVNGELLIEATSNTSVTIKLKGSDGTVRSVVLTLS